MQLRGNYSRRLASEGGRVESSSSISLVIGVVLHLVFVDIYLTLQLIYILKLNDVAELSKTCLTYVAFFVKSINSLMKFGGIAELEESLEEDSTCKWQHCSDDKSKPYVNRIRKIFYALWISSFADSLVGAVAFVMNRRHQGKENKLPDRMCLPIRLSEKCWFHFVRFFVHPTLAESVQVWTFVFSLPCPPSQHPSKI